MPFVDRHELGVRAPARVTWDAVATTLAAMDGPVARGGATLLGCVPRRVSGPPPPAAGAQLPGFAVAQSEPPHRLRLEGHDLLARYRVEFEVGPGHVAVSTWAAFARGPLGALYRFAVIGTGGHALTMRWLLRRIRRRAERSSAVRGELHGDG